MTPGRMRAGGAVFALCGMALEGIGVFLWSGVMSWRITPDGAGVSVLWLLSTGLVLIIMGGRMLLFGRRPRGLLAVLVGLMVVFIVAGVIVTLLAGRRIGQIGG